MHRRVCSMCVSFRHCKEPSTCPCRRRYSSYRNVCGHRYIGNVVCCSHPLCPRQRQRHPRVRYFSAMQWVPLILYSWVTSAVQTVVADSTDECDAQSTCINPRLDEPTTLRSYTHLHHRNQ